MGFSKQECWSGLPFPSPGDLPKPVIELGSPALEADSTSDPMDYTVHGVLQAEYWSGYLFPSPGDLPNSGIKPRSYTSWADSLLAEPQGKPKNTRVGSLSLLQQIFPTQESNGSPALQADSLPTDLAGKPRYMINP